MNPSERLLALYSLLLLSSRAVSLRDMARQMGCSKQTIMRDMEKLEASKFGKLLCERHGRESIYRLERPRKLPELTLDGEGLRQLALCRAFLMHLLPKHMREQTESVLRHAAAYLPEEDGRERIEDVGQALAKGIIDYTPFEERLKTIVAAIRNHRVCVVNYRAAGGGEKRYSFAPKRLIAYRETFHVRGWVVSDRGRAVQKYDKPTDLAVHRLCDVASTQREAGHLPEIVDCGEGVFGIMDGTPFKVRVRFAASAAEYASERLWSDDQTLVRHRDGRLTLTMTVRSGAEAMSWILSFGQAAELLSPRWLREEMAEQVRSMAAYYDSGSPIVRTELYEGNSQTRQE